ncbi:hypothetical protein HOP50_02g19100 [Chloropicon primus]|uniref:Uncharacterized protein n=1 Tax=Chloropicon primus TaxID=1764295 RepID=A0A5B8MIA7_9CHLO|nr:hypothetical protein A3770_02p19130 [Chloropicon primus]UPQ98604.1 hypothetical protein HOP50_02g19100 [Chloropicon primus]|eukprot:QDZ19395.1 hypothetical protein A3770_02p19130 [Chloropicon primus]
MKRGREALPEDFFEGGREGGDREEGKTEGKRGNEEKETAFDDFMTSIVGDGEPSETRMPSKRSIASAGDDEPSKPSKPRATTETEAREGEEEEGGEDGEDEENLVSRGRAAVWRELIEEKKRMRKGKVVEKDSGGSSDESDGDDIGGLTDWRSKGI